jgi:hypothetical protein
MKERRQPASTARPRGAIQANPDKLHSTSWSGGEYPLWYEDLNFTCRDCGKREVWTSRQQQWWYEVAGGAIETVAIRCRACRTAKRRKDAAMTERTRESRQQRAALRAASLSAKLSAKGPDGFAVLDQPVRTLILKERALKQLEAQGIHTIGELISRGISAEVFRRDDRDALKQKLKSIGLSLVGAPIPRP